MQDFAFLSTVSLLADLDRTELEAIRSRVVVSEYSAGQMILEEGTANRAIHIVKDGRVRVTRTVEEKDVNLCDLCTGQTFGEMSILSGGVVTASLKAVTATTIYSLSIDDLGKILQDSPLAAAKFWKAIAQDLCARLTQTNDVVRSYFEVNRAIIENEAFREAYAMCNR